MAKPNLTTFIMTIYTHIYGTTHIEKFQIYYTIIPLAYPRLYNR